jgi:hypothetical protein
MISAWVASSVKVGTLVFFVKSVTMPMVMLAVRLLPVDCVRTQLKYGLWQYLALFLLLLVYW